MSTSECDITTYVLLDSESVGLTFSHIASLSHFRDHVVRPSLRALSEKIEELNLSEDPGDVFLVGDLGELAKRTAEGYVLAVQSMWERGLRGMLVSCEARICNGSALEALKAATWSGKSENLQDHFLRLMGIPIQSFSSYSDLDFLQALGNAIRHGDGNSARRIYQLCPSLWPEWLRPEQVVIFETVGLGAEKRKAEIPPFDSIELPPVALEQMMQSVLWFWEDIENMRCNSFRRKHDSVIRMLSGWKAGIDRRASSRVWRRA